MGTSGNPAAGSTVEAGLPDIVGDSWIRYNNDTGVNSGPFYPTSFASRNPTVATYNGNSNTGTTVGFAASRANGIYGNSSTVQPAAYFEYIWRRIG